MEPLLNQSQGSLIHGFDFSISSNSAQYVEERSERNWLANSNYFRPTGVRTIRVNIADNSFVDLSSLVLVGILHNDDATKVLTPLTPGNPRCNFALHGVRQRHEGGGHNALRANDGAILTHDAI